MKVVAWNIEGRLTRFAEAGKRGSPEHIVDNIQQLDGDIVVLPEASDGIDIEPLIVEKIEALNYKTFTASYDEKRDHTYEALAQPTIKMLSRLEVADFQVLRLGNIRTMFMADVIKPDSEQQLRIFGIHIDDRSEVNRLSQVESLLPHIISSPYPVVAMGDFNAMHGDSGPAQLLRFSPILTAIEHFPIAGMKNKMQRLAQMATGETMRRIESGTDLQRTDPRMRPTITPKMRGQEWMPSFRLAQIDHIFVSPNIAATDFLVAHDGGSDHRAISVNLSLH